MSRILPGHSIIPAVLPLTLFTGCNTTLWAWIAALFALLEGAVIIYVLLRRTRNKALKTAIKDLDSFGHAEPTGLADFDEALSGIEQTMDILKRELKESKEIHDEIIFAQNRLQLSHRLMRAGMMSASVAHDLRGPLTGIMGSASLLKDMNDIPPELWQKHVSNILHQADRCSRIIDELLSRTRAEATKRVVCDLSRLARDLLSESVTLSKGKVRMESSIQDGLSSMVDCTQVWQVLQNLVNNAIEAIRGNGSVWFRLVGQGDRVFCIVEDDGPGIDESGRDKVFDPLYTKKSAGTGMGLAIVKMYVEANNGTIEVSRSQHGGACFTVSFPTYKA